MLCIVASIPPASVLTTKMFASQVRRFSILTRIFSVKTGELQPNGQLNRLAIKKQNKYGGRCSACALPLLPSPCSHISPWHPHSFPSERNVNGN